MLRVSVLLQNNVKREGKLPVSFQAASLISGWAVAAVESWLTAQPLLSVSHPSRADVTELSLWMLKRKLKHTKTIESCNITTQLALSDTSLHEYNTIASRVSFSICERHEITQLSAFPAFLNAQVQDSSWRLRLESAAAWRCRLDFHRDGVAARLQCVTLTCVTSDLVKLPKAPAQQILIRLQLPAVPFPDERTT